MRSSSEASPNSPTKIEQLGIADDCQPVLIDYVGEVRPRPIAELGPSETVDHFSAQGALDRWKARTA